MSQHDCSRRNSAVLDSLPFPHHPEYYSSPSNPFHSAMIHAWTQFDPAAMFYWLFQIHVSNGKVSRDLTSRLSKHEQVVVRGREQVDTIFLLVALKEARKLRDWNEVSSMILLHRIRDKRTRECEDAPRRMKTMKLFVDIVSRTISTPAIYSLEPSQRI